MERRVLKSPGFLSITPILTTIAPTAGKMGLPFRVNALEKNRLMESNGEPHRFFFCFGFGWEGIGLDSVLFGPLGTRFKSRLPSLYPKLRSWDHENPVFPGYLQSRRKKSGLPIPVLGSGSIRLFLIPNDLQPLKPQQLV